MQDKSCKVCGKVQCYDHCYANEGGQHEPDTSSFFLEHDGHGVYLDVYCLHCGQSGCIGKFDASEVTWN